MLFHFEGTFYQNLHEWFKLHFNMEENEVILHIFVSDHNVHLKNNNKILPFGNFRKLLQGMHWPGIKPRPTAQKAAVLTTVPPRPTPNIKQDL